MSAGALGVAMPRRSGAALASPAVVRLVCFGALALFAGLRWATLVAPAGWGRMVVSAGAAVAAAVAWHVAAGRGRRLVAVVLCVVSALAALVAVLLAAGVPLRLVAPAHWGDLVSGLSQGVQSLPGIGVPYRGVDPWVRIALVGSGGLLLLLGAALAVRSIRRSTRPLGAVVVLATTYAIGVVEHPPAHPYLAGAVLTVLVGALLWGDRIERAYIVPAAVFVAFAIAGGAIAAPQLDASKPWVDYQSIIESFSTPPSISYSWNHSYGPLHWPRDNREMLRIAAKTPVYWKAVDLDAFDGVAWRSGPVLSRGLDTEIAPGHKSWHEQLRVTVRDLKSSAYIGAGTGLAIKQSPRYAIPSTSPGTFVTGRDPLQRGDSYLVDVYVPQPSQLQMAAAGSDYPSFVPAYLSMALPASVGGPRYRLPIGVPSSLPGARVQFQQFGLISEPAVIDGLGRLHRNGDAVMRRSQYAPMYDLARKLREESDTPYQFVRAVESRLASGYIYSESPPRPRAGRPPLVSFLFDTKTGYCQQFSGTMAWMLRMGGVPARVASGFTPGVYDTPRREWVVHDLDAHSWVEVYFPRIGWVPFDPTPAVAPPHHQLAGIPAPPGTKPGPLAPNGRRADVPRRAGAGGGRSGTSSGELPFWLVAVGTLLAAFAVVGTVAGARARRLRPAVPVASELAELDRALRLTGRPPEPGVTLRGLEERYRRHAPAAAAYIAAVRLRRYGGRDAPPSPEQRRALRQELAEGLGFGGRLRAWWALPPAWAVPVRGLH